jgi:hypothetical protein
MGSVGGYNYSLSAIGGPSRWLQKLSSPRLCKRVGEEGQARQSSIIVERREKNIG